MTNGPLVQWKLRIEKAGPVELRQIARELQPMVDYQGEINTQRQLTLCGQEQAKIFLEQTFKALFEQDFYQPFKEFKFPFANDQFAAQRVLIGAWTGIEQFVKESPGVLLNERMVVLNMALRHQLNSGIEKDLASTGRSALIISAIDEKQQFLTCNAQNLFMLKLLEMIEIEKGPEDQAPWYLVDKPAGAANSKSFAISLEQAIEASLKKLPIDKFIEFGPDQGMAAAVAMFFMFRPRQTELDTNKLQYIFSLAGMHPRPADLITEYTNLTEAEQRKVIEYEPAKVTLAIESGQAKCFKDILRMAREGAFS